MSSTGSGGAMVVDNMKTVEGLEPKELWQFFAGMSDVPRPSKKEERIRAFVEGLAKEHGFACRKDEVGNLLIEVPASPGCENAPVTVIQGHLDMVCEKNADTRHDFDQDPIQLVLDEDGQGEKILRAAGTTLGADNGIGVALGFAAAISPDVTHGPLELLMTMDEEAGMTGAKGLKPGFLSGKRLLNLDSEEDDSIYIGCAGGCDTNVAWDLPLVAPADGTVALRVSVTGLRGGHSGCDIHEGRGSAIRLLFRTLMFCGPSLRLAYVDAGSMRNAIPREAHAVVYIDADNRDSLSKAAAHVQGEGRAESFEDGLQIAVEAGDAQAYPKCVSEEHTAALMHAVAILPNGVLGMHPKVSELVETSNNISTVKSNYGESSLDIQIGTLSRSSSSTRLAETLRHIASVASLTGARKEFGNDYPGWNPNPDSPLLATCRSLYAEMFGEEAHVRAIHAGLECGVIGERVGEMDMVSFGPRIEGAHSPDERVYVASVQRVWKYLCAVLAALSKG
ncbi:MAG: beta-Ala-His dipeptidase [Phycisphaerae bacterium]